MPATSIDTFFACTLIVIVVVVSMAATTNVALPYITCLEDLNEPEYLRKIAEHTITSSGSPENWGQNQSLTPDIFGLAEDNSFGYKLDLDKVSRLNSQNAYALTYLDVLNTLRLENVALHFSFSQIMDVNITSDSNTTVVDTTTYTFNIYVTRNQAPVATTLNYYIVANNYLNSSSSSTANNGQGTIDVEIPNSSAGTALLVVFARASYDSRVTAQGTYSFGHLSFEPSPNNTFLNLTPLNCTLQVDPNSSEVSLDSAYAFSYSYETSLSSISNETYTIPEFLDSSPQVLAVTGWNGSDYFIEWTTYPQVPLEIGANFDDATECYSFNYIVTIDSVLYRLNIKCGGPSL